MKVRLMALRLGGRLGSTEKPLAGKQRRRQPIVDRALGQGFILRVRAPQRIDPSKQGAPLSEGLLILLAGPQGIIGLRKRIKDYIYRKHLPLK